MTSIERLEELNQELGYKFDSIITKVLHRQRLFDIIMVVNSEGIIQGISHDASLLLGYSDKELRNKSVHTVLCQRINDVFFGQIYSQLDSTNEIMLGDEQDVFLIQKGGSYVPVIIYISKLIDSNGASLFLISAVVR